VWLEKNYSHNTISIANEQHWLVESDQEKTNMKKFRVWILVEVHFKWTLYFFHWVLEISSSLWFFYFFFFILWKILLPIGLKPDRSSTQLGTWVSVFTFGRTWGLMFNWVLTKCDTWQLSIWESDWKTKWELNPLMRTTQH